MWKVAVINEPGVLHVMSLFRPLHENPEFWGPRVPGMGSGLRNLLQKKDFLFHQDILS